MKTLHQRHHWILASAVAALALLTLTEALGQTTGAAAVFEGRPAMAGAQAGTGAMAGPPQGGLGVQGSEAGALRLRRPQSVDAPPAGMNFPQGTPTGDVAQAEPRRDAVPQRDRDPGIAKPTRKPSDKVTKSLKRTREGARYGISPVESR